MSIIAVLSSYIGLSWFNYILRTDIYVTSYCIYYIISLFVCFIMFFLQNAKKICVFLLSCVSKILCCVSLWVIILSSANKISILNNIRIIKHAEEKFICFFIMLLAYSRLKMRRTQFINFIFILLWGVEIHAWGHTYVVNILLNARYIYSAIPWTFNRVQ